MRKIFILFTIILLGLSVYAEGVTLTGETSFNWVDMSQIQRDSTIDHYRQILFGDGVVEAYGRNDFKQKYADFIKDENYKTHYNQAKSNLKENEDANLCSFYIKNDFLYMYAIQYKNNLKNVYYYDALGHLKYVDVISDNYPNFPYTSKQYRVNGTLVSAIYFVSKDMQHLYEPDGKFKGVWYRENMYDKRGLKTLTRTNW